MTRLLQTRVPVRRIAAAAVAASGAVLAVGLSATPAAAASIESAEPAANSQVDEAPHEVRLEFDELVGLSDVTISVTGPDGDATDGRTRTLGDTARVDLKDDLPNGRYAVSWTVRDTALVDGGSGGFAFRIGPVPPRDLPSPTGSAVAPAPPRPTDRATTPPAASSRPSATPTRISSPTATKGRARGGDPITAARPPVNVPAPDVAGIRSRVAEWLPPPVFWWGLVVVAVVGGMTWRRRRGNPQVLPTPPAPSSAPEPHLVPAAGREPAPGERVPS